MQRRTQAPATAHTDACKGEVLLQTPALDWLMPNRDSQTGQYNETYPLAAFS